MKKLLYSLLAGLFLMGPMSCKDDDPAGPTLVTAPEATAENDTKSGGVYKGTLIGSSGVFKLVLQGGKKEFVCTIDGVTKTLTTTDLESWTSGDEIVEAEFVSGDWKVYFSVAANGESASLAFQIAGHPNINASFIKEYSTALVKAFEGSYAGTSTGTWNFIIIEDQVFGISQSSTTPGPNGAGYLVGTVDGTALTGTVNQETVVAGTLNGNTVTGTWTTQDPALHGTWTGTRTL
jgi:hypothetical protein